MTKHDQTHNDKSSVPSEGVCSPSIPPAPEGGAGALVRDEAGRFPAGVSGNPAGKPRGTRNQITVLRENFELALLEYANKPTQRTKALAAMDRMFDIMANGESKEAVAAYKAMFGKVTPDAKQPVEDVGDRAPPTVNIVITNATAKEVKVIPGEATEVFDNE